MPITRYLEMTTKIVNVGSKALWWTTNADESVLHIAVDEASGWCKLEPGDSAEITQRDRIED